MIFYRNVDFRIEPKIHKTKKGTFDDNIFCFDIETISLFDIEGTFQPFDYSRPAEYYSDREKVAIPYIWQFGINGIVFYGRELHDFRHVLEEISNKEVTRIIYVHNLSYEFEFLLDILEDYTIEQMVATNIRQPISFYIKELNIQFRCSYKLTNMSLDLSAKKYANTRKAVGELDYNIPYSPICPLPKKVHHYAEMDIITLTEIIEHFREEYGHIHKIPLTQTGEVRRDLNKRLDYWYHKKMWDSVPESDIFGALMVAFSGGITHANILHAGKVKKNMWSFDIASSYPYSLLQKLPSEPFFKIPPDQVEFFKKDHAILFHVKLSGISSKYYNHYISYNKCLNVSFQEIEYIDPKGVTRSFRDEDIVVDNGRVVSCGGSFEMIITDVDFDLIRQSYDIDEIEIKRAWASYKDYIDKRVMLYILEKYVAKTKLKNDPTQKDYYMKSKQYINSIYGMSVSNPCKRGIEFKNGEWSSHALEEDGFIEKCLEEYKKSYSNLLPYYVGVWVTAYSRRALWSNILKLDKQVVYYDTDSIKGIGDFGTVFDDYNKQVIDTLKVASELNHIDIEMFMPTDDKGTPRPIGVFEREDAKKFHGVGTMKFKTLGAKKYYYTDEKNRPHLTVSGVRKSAVKDIKNFDDFSKGHIFDYKMSGKLTHFYNDEQPVVEYKDANGNIYRSKQKHGIILQPTTYSLGITELYETLIEEYAGIIPDEI